MGGEPETRNLILAVALSVLVIVGWYALFPPTPPEPPQGQETAGAESGGAAPDAGGATGAEAPAVALGREAALEASDRVAVDSPTLTGSISLTGARLDDLKLDNYREELDPGSDTVTLLNPVGGPSPYFVVHGWLPTRTGSPGALPGPGTPWRLAEGGTLAPGSPVTLEWENGSGLVFRRTISVDERYMFTVRQSVENTREERIDLAPYGYVARRGQPETRGMWILHEGALGVFDEELREVDYDDMLELPPDPQEAGLVERVGVQSDGWLGFTDKYWMTTLVPEPGRDFAAVFKAVPGSGPEFRTEMRLPVVSLAPGATEEITTRVFAGAKEVGTIRDYQRELGIDRFEDSVDWGWFYFLTKPIFTMLHWISIQIGNMGWAIIALTFVVKAILFPLAYKSYVSMSKMKALQPEMQRIKERAGEDRQRMQQEMMELYKREKVNPASGCLPILLQIPVFFALYKVLFVTIEMRHAPWVGWIEDLSAPDPSSWMTLFGLVPWDIPVFLEIFSIGILPIFMGATMWLQQKLNPAPTDPTQQMIFAWMPWVFMFILGQFAAGLVLYWTANNVITILQQYIIMRSQGVDVDLFGNIKKSFKRKRGQAAAATAGAGAGSSGDGEGAAGAEAAGPPPGDAGAPDRDAGGDGGDAAGAGGESADGTGEDDRPGKAGGGPAEGGQPGGGRAHSGSAQPKNRKKRSGGGKPQRRRSSGSGGGRGRR
jgi:YidC/Oxa1 family membrane protein insertase